MKIVYVGDNRNRYNFGCRATSTALSMLLSRDNEIVGRVYGNYTNEDAKNLFFRRWISSSMYEKLGSNGKWNALKEIICPLSYYAHKKRVSLTKLDFISYDFEKSIQNLIKCIPANPILKECDLRQYDFDALVVNGEGSFIFSSTPWRESVVESMLMYWAKKMGKKVFLLNAMLSDMPGEPTNMGSINALQDLFNKIDLICVREYDSLEYAKKYFPNANIDIAPDALFSWYSMICDDFTVGKGNYLNGKNGATDESYFNIDLTKPYVCISGSSSSLISRDKNQTIKAYCELVQTVQKATGLDVYLVQVCDGDSFLIDVAKITRCMYFSVDTPIILAGKILANSMVYITGRYHPAILASLGGTPCIFMGSNSHKTNSIQKLLRYKEINEYCEVPSPNDIANIVSRTKYYLENNDSIRKEIQKVVKELSKHAEEMRYKVK